MDPPYTGIAETFTLRMGVAMKRVYDVCIIGSGAGGSPVAYELAKAGYSVVVLEKGKWYKEENFSKDELALCRRQIYSPPLSEEFHIVNLKESGSYVRYDGREYDWSFWNGCVVGGASNFMSGYFHRLKPKDFVLRSSYGPIAGANVVDWPITYEDLEPYYTKAEHLIGVSGRVQRHSFLEPRSTPDFPYPPLAESGVTHWFDAACEALGYEYFPTPRAILSRNTQKRGSCYYSNYCGSYPCSSGAKGSARAALLQPHHIPVITEAFVYHLESDAKRIKAAWYYDKEGKEQKVTAKIFVVAATPIETCRLLLHSKNHHFPRGLSNNHGQVGKNLIFSAGGSGSGVFRKSRLTKEKFATLMEPGLFFNRSIQQWYEYEKDGKRYKGGTIDFLFEHANIIPRVMRQIWDEEGNILWGKELQRCIEEHVPNERRLNFEVFNDWLPTDGTFIALDTHAKDKWGVPVAAIYLDSHPHDLEVGDFLAKKAMQILQKMEAEDITSDISSAPPSNLVAGGCRFGKDPKTSVLNPHCRSWEVENLYITDASFMPTGGSVPYTWSIYANSLRVAEAIKKVL